MAQKDSPTPSDRPVPTAAAATGSGPVRDPGRDKAIDLALGAIEK